MRYVITILLLAALAGCGTVKEIGGGANVELATVAESSQQWTGVAITFDGRIFINFPRWSDAVPVSVGELQADGSVKPFPNVEWNNWAPGKDPKRHFVCVQSVYVDSDGALWILDPARLRLQGVVKNGPKLIKVDLKRNQIARVIGFDETVAPPRSYLNDVRVDTKTSTAYISDSGLGAIVVVDLETGRARRLLADHPSTKSEDIDVVIDGKPWRRPDGSKPQVHCDGIALHPTGKYLMYHALTARTLYWIETKWLRDLAAKPSQYWDRIERVANTGPVDGIMYDPKGYLYLSCLEENAIKRLTPAGEIELLVKDPRIQWPDSFTIPPDGRVLFTTSQINLGPNPKTPYRLFELKPR